MVHALVSYVAGGVSSKRHAHSPFLSLVSCIYVRGVEGSGRRMIVMGWLLSRDICIPLHYITFGGSCVVVMSGPYMIPVVFYFAGRFFVLVEKEYRPCALVKKSLSFWCLSPVGEMMPGGGYFVFRSAPPASAHVRSDNKFWISCRGANIGLNFKVWVGFS